MSAVFNELPRWLTWPVAVFLVAFFLAPAIVGAAPPREEIEEEDGATPTASQPATKQAPTFRLTILGAASDARDRDLRLILNYRRSPRLLWNFTLGRAQIGTTPEFKFTHGNAGLRYGGPETSFFVNLGVWGDESVIRSRDFDTGVILKKNIWQWTLGWRYRQIDSDVGRLVPGEFSGDGSAQGRGLFSRLSVQATPGFSAYLSAADNQYAAASEELEELFAARLIDSRSVTLISQFPVWNYSVGVNLSRGREKFNVDYTVVQTIFQALRPEIFSAAVTVPTGSTSALSFRAGQRNTPGFSKVYFAGLAFSTGF